jgi:NAD(P)-dependent dehydrogenase (short-subunit alcohol dehydrogenase family)
MLTDLRDRVAVVTGAGSGIGAAMCRRFSAEGMRVVAADIDEEAVAQVAATLDDAVAVPVDVARRGDVEALADRAFDAYDQVDVLCNNAGVFQGGLSWTRQESDWDWTFGVNVYGIVHAIAAFVPRMLAQGTDGHVVNTASIAAFVSGPFSAPYIVSKAAAFMLSECLAHDLASTGSRIGVSVLVPSAIDTAIARSARVRPSHLGQDGTEDATTTLEFLAATTAAGLQPDEITDPIVAAIRSGEFLIPTKPSYRRQLGDRFEDLLARRLPRFTVVD